MALLNQNDAKIVGEKLSGLPGSVKLALFMRELECDYCDRTRELVEELAALSAGKLTVEVYDLVKDAAKAQGLGIDKAPALAVLGADGEDRGLRFFGIPAGYEFASLLESLDLVARGDSGLAPAVREKLRSLKEPLALQVFVTPTCPYCPKAVLTAFKFAMESPLVTAAMVEATEFPELSSRYQVSGVPHTVIGGSPQAMIGAYPDGAAADMVLSAALRG
jgi:glutaredoxin-like protein